MAIQNSGKDVQQQKCSYIAGQFDSVQFSHSVVSDSVWPIEPQHARPPCPSPTPGSHPNPCPLSWWCHPTISCSVISFSSWPQSFPASGSFQMSQVFASGGQSIGVSASASVLPMTIQELISFITSHSKKIIPLEWLVISQLFYKESWAPKNLMHLNCGVGEDSRESLVQQGDQNQSILKEVSP